MTGTFGPRRGRGRRRRGVVFYLVVGLLVLVLIAGGAYFGFMRGETLSSRNVLARERAWCLARAGVAAGLGWFRAVGEAPGPFRRILLTRSADEVNDTPPLDLPVASHPALRRIMDDLRQVHGDEGVLRVTLELTDFRPLDDVARSPSGVVYDPGEMAGLLRLRARAAWGDASVTLSAFKRVFVMRTVPPVVSKFTLFARSVTGLASASETGSTSPTPNMLNRAVIERDGGRGRLDPAGPFGLMTLWHGLRTDLDDRGFVFLGSRVPLTLNLAFGGGRDGEGHHLLGWLPRLVPPSINGYSIASSQVGFLADLGSEVGVFRDLDLSGPPEDPITDGGAVLHLMGSADGPSPTVILGPLKRRYLDLRYARMGTDLVALPHTTFENWLPTDFSTPDYWTTNFPDAVRARDEVFQRNRLKYRPAMSNVRSEDPYNAGVDVASERSSPSGRFQSLGAVTRVRHLEDGRRAFLFAPVQNTGRVMLHDDGRHLLFAGALADLGGEREPHVFGLGARAVVAAPASSFAAFLAGRPRRIPGCMSFSGPEGLVIDAPMALDDGGMLVAEGSVTVRAKVSVRGTGRPLVIVSLTGDVVVATGEVVQASLVAMTGTLRKTVDHIRIMGSVAVGHLSPLDLLRGGSSRVDLFYDDRLDPTRTGNRHALVDVFVEPGLRQGVGG